MKNDEHTPSHFAAARRTIGVSSVPSAAKLLRNSSWSCGGTLSYIEGKRAHDDVLDVNHSPCASRFRRGI